MTRTVTRTVLDMEVEGVRPRGRLRYMDNNTIYNKNNGLMDVIIIYRNDSIIAVARATYWCGRAFKVRITAIFIRRTAAFGLGMNTNKFIFRNKAHIHANIQM